MLYIAAQHNRETMVRHLLDMPEVPNDPNADGVTPLMIALKEGNTDIVRTLLEHDGRPENNHVKQLLEERDNDDKNVFHYAFGSLKPAEATQILVEFCSLTYQKNYSKEMEDFLTSKDLNEDTPFHILVQQKSEKGDFNDIFKSLINIKTHAEDTQSSEGEFYNVVRAANKSGKRRKTSLNLILECMKEAVSVF